MQQLRNNRAALEKADEGGFGTGQSHAGGKSLNQCIEYSEILCDLQKVVCKQQKQCGLNLWEFKISRERREK